MNRTTDESKQTNTPKDTQQQSGPNMMMMFMMVCCGLPLLLLALPLLGISWSSPNSWLILAALAAVVVLCIFRGHGARHKNG